MRLQIKKILAREFLLLTITISLGFIVFLLTYPYNLYRQNNASKLEVIIHENTNLADSLSKAFELKTTNQEWLHKKVLDEYDVGTNPLYTKDGIWEQLTFLAKTDSIKFRWGTKWKEEWTPFFKKIGFANPDSLKKFVNSNTIQDNDIEMKNRSKELKKETINFKDENLKIKNKVLSYSEQINFGISAFIILGLLLFVLRYIVYAVQWSLKTLKEK